ncbi:MAG: SEFIR domain-containing protein [Myxococcota bacterium]
MSTTTFISYSHDSGTHEDLVRALADQLRADGVDIRLDQYVQSPEDGWPHWTEAQIETCRFVVMVFTPDYRRRYDLANGRTSPSSRQQATWETMLVRHLLYSAGGRNAKVIPVLFRDDVEGLVPLPLRGSTYYRLPEDYEALLRRLLDKPKTVPRPLGTPPELKPAPRPDFFSLMKADAPAALARKTGVAESGAERSEASGVGESLSEGAEVRDTETAAERSAVTRVTERRAEPVESSALMLPVAPDRRLALWVFTANGVARPPLRLDKELRAIKKVLDGSRLGDRFELKVSPMASFLDVIRDLDVHQPAFVHFGGHGDSASGHLVLEGEREGDETFVSPEQIATLLANLRRPPTLVTFSACCSAKMAQAAARYADHAIGFDGEFDDATAPRFSAALYERLMSHAQLDVKRAFEMARLACQPEDREAAELARLYSLSGKGAGSATAVTESSGQAASLRRGREVPAVDVLVVTALKEELDALLAVEGGVREPWILEDGEPPRYEAVLDGDHGLLRVAALRLTGMGGAITAATIAPLLDAMAPRSLVMCGVCAGHPQDTDRGDVVIADRVFQHDEGKVREDGFQGDLWVSEMADPWLREAQELRGAAEGLCGYAPASEEQGRWWLLEQLRDGRNPLRSVAVRRYLPDERRAAVLEMLRDERVVQLRGDTLELTEQGCKVVDEHRLLHDTLAVQAPYHVHVGPMGSGNAVVADGEVWARLTRGGMRKILAIDMEAAAIGRLARTRSLPFAVVKGVMDHGDAKKSDRFKAFAAQAAAEVLVRLLRRVVATPSVKGAQ